jgi:Transposase DDE domain
LNFHDSVRFLKDHSSDSLSGSLIRQACRRVGYQWRQRKLGPVETLQVFMQQVLNGNTAIQDIKRITHSGFSNSSFCNARARIPLPVYKNLQLSVVGNFKRQADADPLATWCDLRVFLMDSTSFSMPDTKELREYFGLHGLQKEGCGFPTARLLCLFDGTHGYLLKTIASPLRTHDLAKTAVLHEALRPGDVLVGDTAFASYAHLASCWKRGFFGVFPVHQKQIVSFQRHRRHRRPGQRVCHGECAKGLPTSRWIRRLGKRDQLVEYFKPKKCPKWMTQEEYDQLPESMVVRELRYRVREPGRRTRVVTLMTTLLDPKRYPAAAIAKLYGLRWRVETYIKDLKHTMKLAVLKCETVAGVLKELTVFAIIYNLVRRVMVQAARQQRVPVERISFIDALRCLKEATPGERLAILVVNPWRPHRFEPRKVKRRKKKYPHLKQPRKLLKKLMKRQGLVT